MTAPVIFTQGENIAMGIRAKQDELFNKAWVDKDLYAELLAAINDANDWLHYYEPDKAKYALQQAIAKAEGL